jgi:hypothetical protein
MFMIASPTITFVGKNTFRLLITCLLSTALHSIGGVILFVKTPEFFTRTSQKPLSEKNILLEFVPASSKVQEKKPLNPSPLISEKNTSAQNPLSKPDLPKNDPYQHGIVEHPSLERSSFSMPPAPPPRKDSPQIDDEKIASKKLTSLSQTEFLKIENIKSAGDKEEKKQIKEIEKEEKIPKRKTEKPKVPLSQRVKKDGMDPGPLAKADDFTSPARKNVTTTSEILEEWSYNTKSHAIARYFSSEFKKISNIWQLELYSSQEFATSLFYDLKKTVVVFKIMPDGKLENLQIIEHDGNELAQRFPVFAIEKTAPFKPLPPKVLSYIRTDGLWVKIEFNYTSEKKK